MKNKPAQSGIAHILFLLSAMGVILFILISQSADFKDKLFSALFPKPSSEASAKPQKYFVPETLVVNFDGRMDSQAKLGLLKQLEASVSAEVPNSNMVIVHVQSDRIDRVLEALSKNPQISLVKKIELSAPVAGGNAKLADPIFQGRDK